MSRLFYDHLLELEELNDHIREICETEEERFELWDIVDEIIHHRVLGCVLDCLPREEHNYFLDRYRNEPYNIELMVFIQERIEDDIEEKIKTTLSDLQEELLRELME